MSEREHNLTLNDRDSFKGLLTAEQTPIEAYGELSPEELAHGNQRAGELEVSLRQKVDILALIPPDEPEPPVSYPQNDGAL